MAFKAADQQDEAMSEINMTPLVDVMLVLLVMSVLSWVVIAYKAMGVLQHRRMARQAVQWCHWSAEQRKAWREQTTDLDPYATLTDLGHEAVRELARLRRDQPHKKVDEADWIRRL